ncbi:Peptidase propeptide and YPEB domain-containing protein [Sinosporangium album]|uniref:Peptidase propeptide and YPEB domain-containing protein n=1 Tax=Sinosporangium album TaxID=504805 RepID=A0A1G8CZ90_9ACTN|nr:M36 family metallopeptidase [Sinosporangium album]SDH50907.1 Peptidase propeptide and YPEB domain-containing protein [Sinosporangium album]
MSPRPLLKTTLLAATAASLAFPLAVAGAGPALGEPGAPTRAAADFQGEEHAKPDLDNRTGRVEPPASAQAKARSTAATATIRWNALGTPSVITSPTPLAEGLGSDPERAARAYLKANENLFGLPAAAVDALEKIAVNPIGAGHAVMLRQRFGTLPAGQDGTVTVGLADGKVFHVTSTLSRETGAPPAARITEQRALEIAARDGEIDLATAATKEAAAVAVPAPGGVHNAWQVTLIGGGEGEPAAYTTHVDAVSGAILTRENLVDHLDPEEGGAHSVSAHAPEGPAWAVFPANPPADYSSADTRVLWCLSASQAGCERVKASDPATGKAWDVDHTTDGSSGSSLGNAARTFENRASGDSYSVGTRSNAAKADRAYRYPWTNQWYEAKCDPATFDSPGEADLEAAIANLNAAHNRMHDWAYRLGFSETAWNMQTHNGDRGGVGNDPELGNAQAGARLAHVRNNANQITPRDGIAPVTNMYLWQPTAGGFYGPCVDGDYDMSVIGHEYTHAISGRMIGGPLSGWQGAQAGAMNESTSDLFAMEYLYEYGYRPRGETPYVTGGYVTGDAKAGIRNYDMSRSPLNYSNIAYDVVGQQVHADGEIWSATQFDVRRAFIKRYGLATPKVQRACAEGHRPLDACPGNRRWVQLSFDALLLMTSGAVSYIDHRDAILAADAIRFGGANQDILWNAFAGRGLGKDAAGTGPNDPDPTPSFASPHARNATATLAPEGEAANAPIRLYVGDYENRSVPVADTDPETPLGPTFEITPGTYSFLATGPGFGHTRFTETFTRGETETLDVEPARNHASAAAGATATGDGVNHAELIDGTESTNWASLTGPAAGRTVTVDLAGTDPVKIRRVLVSAMLRPNIGDPEDRGSQNRFSALRSFEILACNSAAGSDCADPSAYSVIHTSKANAFDARRPRPRGADLLATSFAVRPTEATHLALRALTTQCTGNPVYAGEQDNDPNSATDCTTSSASAGQVRAAELQAFTR